MQNKKKNKQNKTNKQESRIKKEQRKCHATQCGFEAKKKNAIKKTTFCMLFRSFEDIFVVKYFSKKKKKKNQQQSTNNK